MLYEVKIKVADKPWLGQQKSKDKTRKFRRDKRNRIAIDSVQWQWAFESAAKALDYAIDVETIRTESGIPAPSISLYNRKYHSRGKPMEEMFEAIREGTVLTFDILLMESGAVGGQVYRAPSQEELHHILDYVGMFIGLSPWGSRWGYGRFELVDLSRKSNKINVTTPPRGVS